MTTGKICECSSRNCVNLLIKVNRTQRSKNYICTSQRLPRKRPTQLGRRIERLEKCPEGFWG
jgi:hypothetical protein